MDGTENNEVWVTGAEQAFSIADAVEEVSVQTGNFGVEFGRAGGGVFNVVTKSGTNDLHGTLLWRYQSQRFDSISGNFVTWPGSVPVARTLPSINITNVAAPGLNSQNTQFHYGNNFLFQETQTKLSGRHAFRYGVEFLQQTITEARGTNDLGVFTIRDAVGYSAFANYLDDFGGPSASAGRAFGAPVLHPNQFHQSYFFASSEKFVGNWWAH